MRKRKTFVVEERVRLYDTDAEGVVHYAGYYRFFTDAIENFAYEFFGGYPIPNRNIIFVVVESSAKYHKPAFSGDRLKVEISPTMLSGKAIRFDFKIRKNQAIICDGYIVQVCISKRSWKAVPISGNIRKVFSGW